MSKPRFPRDSDRTTEPSESAASPGPVGEDIVRRANTPFVMTSVGRRAKNTFGWEAGQTMYFSPDDPN